MSCVSRRGCHLEQQRRLLAGGGNSSCFAALLSQALQLIFEVFRREGWQEAGREGEQVKSNRGRQGG